MEPKVRLTKWYLDCVSDRGAAAILYWAALRWGPFGLRYGGAVHRATDGQPIVGYTLRPGPSPVLRDSDRVDWTSDRLGIRAHWRRSEPAIHRTLFDSSDGAIQWDCMLPHASASVTIGTRTITGLGYVERLTMTLPPWRVPCDELRWGRFLSDSESLVWIDWHGPTPRSWVFSQGTEHRSAEISTRGVVVPNAGIRLEIGESTDLRTGVLRHTALSPMRGLVSLLPRWRHAREEKWLARATLAVRNGSSAGWVIHERVTWE